MPVRALRPSLRLCNPEPRSCGGTKNARQGIETSSRASVVGYHGFMEERRMPVRALRHAVGCRIPCRDRVWRNEECPSGH